MANITAQLEAFVEGEEPNKPTTPPWAQACPNLWELLCWCRWRGGRHRPVPRVQIERGTGCWCVTLTEPALKMNLRIEVDTWEGIPEALERAIQPGRANWRQYDEVVLPTVKEPGKGKKG